MERINEDNYACFFLDYHEGRLSAEDVAELLLFLEKHPELKEVFEDLEPIVFPETDLPEVHFDLDKIKNMFVNENNYDEYMARSIDGLLDEKEVQALNLFLSRHPEYQRDMELYKLTVIEPDLSIVFSDLEKLKKKKTRVIPIRFNPWMAAAAAVALLIGIWIYTREPAVDSEMVAIRLAAEQKLVPQQEPTKEQEFPVSALPVPAGSGVATIKHSVQGDYTSVHPEPVQPTELVKSIPARNMNPLVAGVEQPMPEIQAVPEMKDFTEPIADVTTGYPDLKTLARQRLTTLTGSEIPSKGSKHTGWALVKIAVRGYNRLSPRKIMIKEEYNNQGMLVSYALQSRDLAYQQQTKE